MIVIASSNGAEGAEVAWDVLARGGSALDAVEAGCRVVEDDPTDHTVGLGGYPNLLGEVELDASIMDGTTRNAGAVGSLRGYRAAITGARAVMERLPHVLVVGDGAARLAEEIGLRPEDLLTDDARATWEKGVSGTLDPSDPGAAMLSQVAELATDPERAPGTVNFLARDSEGRLASGVSTSGWAWKFPGRLGDTPVIGAGNYCDTRYGAAACTGFGELSIRGGTARSVVRNLELGMAAVEAGRAAVSDLFSLDVDPADLIMHTVVLGAGDDHAGLTTRDEGRTYAVRTAAMSAVELLPRTVVRPG
jgi:L-asparaginase / beta-aspartyl-peptidase